MAVLPVQTAVPATAPVFATASVGGDEFENSGAPFLLITASSPKTMTVLSPHAGLPNLSIPIATGGTISNRFDPLRWNDPATGRVRVTFNSVVGVTLAAVRVVLLGFDPLVDGYDPFGPPPDLFA